MDGSSSILLTGPSEEELAAWTKCAGGWVEVVGFADRTQGGGVDLTRIEQIRSVTKNLQCWPGK
jgi:hypothetical protein